MPKEIPVELVPPAQTPIGSSFTITNAQYPFYRFVAINKAGESNLEIWSSTLALKTPALSDDTYVEKVVQTYSVQTPYTEVIDGQSFTKFRTEHRTRQVPITKRLPKTETPKNELVQETFTASVPYTEHLEDGTTVTRTRLESRTRLVDPNEVPPTVTTMTDSTLEPLENVTFYDLTGKTTSADAAFGNTGARVPAIQIADALHITDYFSRILAADAVLFTVARTSPNDESRR